MRLPSQTVNESFKQNRRHGWPGAGKQLHPSLLTEDKVILVCALFTTCVTLKSLNSNDQSSFLFHSFHFFHIAHLYSCFFSREFITAISNDINLCTQPMWPIVQVLTPVCLAGLDWWSVPTPLNRMNDHRGLALLSQKVFPVSSSLTALRD